MKDKIVRFLKSKGYYMILGLCVLTVGTVSFLSYRASQKELSEIPLDPGGSQDVEKVKEDVTDNATSEQLPEKEPQVEAADYDAPLEGEITAGFSPKDPLYSQTLKDWRTHSGVDLAAAAGTQVLNVCEGAVESVTEDDLTGNTVVVRHTDGKVSRYASLGEVYATEGQILKKGEPIGTVGRSMLLECGETDHLHYELWQDDQAIDPLPLWK